LTKPEKDIPTNGFFFDHDAATFGLGVSQGTIFVLLRDRLLTYRPELQTQNQVSEEGRIFTVNDNGVTIVQIAYMPAKPFWNFFYMEDEDVDGFLWIHNVLSSSERRAILIEHNNSG